MLVAALLSLAVRRRHVGRVVAAIQGERLRIARELHDIVGHRLLAITIHARHVRSRAPGRCPSADAIEELARLTQHDVRAMLGVLRCARPGDVGPVSEPLHHSVTELAARMPVANLGVDLDNVDREHQVGPELRATVLRVVQESVTNALKHGNGPIRVGLSFGDELVITVLNGRPAGSAPVFRPPGACGLRGIGERVSAHGGTFAYGPVGADFLVRARIPVGELDQRRHHREEGLWTASAS